MFRSKRVALALLMMALAACTKADVKPDGVNGDPRGKEATGDDRGGALATFYVDKLEGRGELIHDPKGKTSAWKIPQEASFSFSACIGDRSTRKEAVGHRFKVVIPDQNLTILDVTPTRPNGCFTWLETIPFQHFVKKSRWVVVERDIVGTGVHTGVQRVRLALNPWALGGDNRDKGDAVVFLRDRALDKRLMPTDKNEVRVFGGDVLGDDTLFVDDVSVQVIRRGERNTGTFLRLNISMEPKVRFENASGVPGFKSIPSGEFMVFAHLVLSGAGAKLKDKVILTSAGDAGPKKETIGIRGFGRVIDGKLVARLDAWVDPRLPQGNVELALKLEPVGIRGLAGYEGIYELGSLRSLSGNMAGSLSEECRDQTSACKFAEYLKSTTNFEELRKQGLASHNSPYLLDRMRLRFVQVQPGETTTHRTVAYSASTCVIDSYTGERVVGLPFNIRYKVDAGQSVGKEVVIPKSTDEGGCLNWDYQISHEYYKPEEFFENVVSIERATGVSRELRFYINPWDDKFTFGFDEREFTPDFWKKLKERKKIKSRFFLADYGYHTVKFQYNIDSLMALEVRKTVLMELQPQVLRYSGIINARKMTEPLRDGIWLLKVGIQKNYLDPAQAGLVIDTLQEAQAVARFTDEPAGADGLNTANRLRKLGIEAQTKEYISTETTLVRVTDGFIIQPVELRMQDLRMMRVRTNMMIQLEPVDERKLQAHNALHDGLKKEIEGLLESRRAKAEELGKDGLEVAEKAEIKAEEERIRKMVTDRQQLSKRVLTEITRQMNTTGMNFQINLDSFKLEPDQVTYLAPLLDKVGIELQKNDFTNIRLPSCGEIDCNSFIESEDHSGLAKRTFVGPVIFLSNAYKDSVRATDNLDEARCNDVRVEFDDLFEAELRALEREAFAEADSKVSKERQNTFYRFNEYFGSLRHLCNKHVDELIDRERKYQALYDKGGSAVASIYRFADQYNLDILSLADEKPKDIDIDPDTLKRCGNDLVACMKETERRWLPRAEALKSVNKWLKTASINLSYPWRWFSSQADDVKLEDWDLRDLRSALFDRSSPRASHYAACAINVRSLVRHVERQGGVVATGNGFGQYKSWETIEEDLLERCLASSEDTFVWDHKLRVFKTGQDGDSYIFLGGLQLNLNVGQSFSVSRSNAFSWSVGFEFFDMVGWAGPKAKGMGVLLKPLDAKVGRSHSFGDSSGTSISDSTYLVAQIAGFKVRLDEFERCSVISFRRKFFDNLKSAHKWQLTTWVNANRDYLTGFNGVLACEGELNDKPRYVKESYYYFTQHFTEGDMLDQADLYNHPWLLALRGRRDFGVFLGLIRAQEAVGLKNFYQGAVHGQEREMDWPLDQMLTAYKQITPSFPGFYTELEDDEKESSFPLERRMKKVDSDINFEVISPDRRVPQQPAN